MSDPTFLDGIVVGILVAILFVDIGIIIGKRRSGSKEKIMSLEPCEDPLHPGNS